MSPPGVKPETPVELNIDARPSGHPDPALLSLSAAQQRPRSFQQRNLILLKIERTFLLVFPWELK